MANAAALHPATEAGNKRELLAHVRPGLLAEGLVGCDGHSIRKVQAALVLAHGDANARVEVTLDECLIEPAALASEQEKRTLAVHRIGVVARHVPREQVQLVSPVRLEERVRTWPLHDFDVVPVIAPRTLQVALRQAEAHRLYQMQHRARAGACAGDVARVLGNLRFDKHNVQGFHFCLLFRAMRAIRNVGAGFSAGSMLKQS